jgi:hypothetical protein
MRWASVGSRSWAIPLAVRAALGCALLSEGVLSVVSVAGLARSAPKGLDWFAGMADSGVASLRAAAEGPQKRGTRHTPRSVRPALGLPCRSGTARPAGMHCAVSMTSSVLLFRASLLGCHRGHRRGSGPPLTALA